MTDARTESRAKEIRASTRRRLVLAARVQLTSGGGISQLLIDDISSQVGIHPHAFRVLFPSYDDFLDAINESLVAECADRLRGAVDQFDPVAAAEDVLATAAVALASSLPLTRSGMLIRANRRARGLSDNEFGRQISAAERQFVGALLDVFTDLMTKLGRRFSWSPKLAVRVLLDTYERSFETWILDGHDESDYATSPYITRTLPVLLAELTEVAGPRL